MAKPCRFDPLDSVLIQINFTQKSTLYFFSIFLSKIPINHHSRIAKKREKFSMQNGIKKAQKNGILFLFSSQKSPIKNDSLYYNFVFEFCKYFSVKLSFIFGDLVVFRSVIWRVSVR